MTGGGGGRVVFLCWLWLLVVVSRAKKFYNFSRNSLIMTERMFR